MAQQVKTWGPPSYVTVADVQTLERKATLKNEKHSKILFTFLNHKTVSHFQYNLRVCSDEHIQKSPEGQAPE